MRSADLNNLPAETKAAIAREQIQCLKSDRRRWHQLSTQAAHRTDAIVQLAKIAAEIERFREWGGLNHA